MHIKLSKLEDETTQEAAILSELPPNECECHLNSKGMNFLLNTPQVRRIRHTGNSMSKRNTSSYRNM